MAIRELSHERRNMMIPRYPRLDQHYSPNAAENISCDTTGDYGLISANYSMDVTLYEPSIVEVVFNGLFRHHPDANAWRWYLCRIQETTTGTNMAYGGSFDYHGALTAAVTGEYRGSNLIGMIELPAGGPYTFEVGVRVPLAATWDLYQGHMHIKVIRT